MARNSGVLQYGNNMDDVSSLIYMSSDAHQKVYFIFAPTLGGVIIATNLLVLLSSGLVLCKRRQPRSVYIFLANIAFANILTGAAAFSRQFNPMAHPAEMVCSVSIGLIVSATLSSVYSIGLIGIDRFYFILYGLQYQQFSTPSRATLMVLGTWMLGGAIGFLPAMGVRNFSDDKTFCFFITLAPTSLVLATVSVGILPLIMILVLYGIVLKRALGRIAKNSQFKLDAKLTRYLNVGSNYVAANKDGVSHLQEEPLSQIRTGRAILRFFQNKNTFKLSSVISPRRSKALKIVLCTALCYLITWVPYFSACALYALCDAQKSPVYCHNLRVAIESLLAILGLVNSLLYPFIYAWWHYELRKSAKRILNGFWSQGNGPQISTLQLESTLSTQAISARDISKKRRVSEPAYLDPQRYTANWGYIDL